MRGKILFGVGLGIGYVLGTRAGRKRYEQLKSVAESLWNAEPVQHSVDAAKGFALTYTGDAAESILDAIKKLVRAATKGAERASESAPSASAPVPEAKKAPSSAGSAKPATRKTATPPQAAQ
ncbi:MAG: YtxH domain-containing protein [Agromyces sp.]